MPYDHPRSLSADEVYSVTAFLLFKNGIIPETQEINEKSLPQVKMPNRDGFVPDARPDIKPSGLRPK
jgi:cytochrome c